MIAAKTQHGTSGNNQEPGGRCCQADMESRYRHEVAGSGLRVAQPLFGRNPVPCADGNSGKYRCRVRILDDRLQPPDDVLPETADRFTAVIVQPAVALAVDDVARRADALPEQPGFVIKYPGVARSTRPPQPHFQLPYLANLRTFCGAIPAQAYPRRNPRVVDGPRHKTGHRAPAARKIGDLEYGQHAVALEPRREPQVDDVQPLQRKQG